MANHRHPYSVFPRTTPKGKKYYYYQTYDQYGRRTSAKSTYCPTKGDAKRYCDRLLAEGRLVNDPGSITFERYAEPWWIWGKCKYVLKKAAKDEHGDGLSRDYVEANRRTMKRHIIPYFEGTRLVDIDFELCEDFLFYLSQKVSYKFANNIFGIFTVMMAEAVRRKLIRENPTKGLQRLKPIAVERDLFTGDEVSRLFVPENWGGITQGYLANILAASTGMRYGEIRALKTANYYGAYIDVRENMTNRGQTVRTKTKETRMVPVPKRVRALLNEYGNTEGRYLVSNKGGARPMSLHHGRNSLYKALDEINIFEEERERRNLDFHSWRWLFETTMRARGVPDSKIRDVMGHRTKEMSEHYTSFREEDYADLISVQGSIWS